MTNDSKQTATKVRQQMLIGIVQDWNRRHPIGTPILFWPGAMEGPGKESKVRSEAWIMPNGVAVAMVEDYAGGIALMHIGFRSMEDFLAAENGRA